MYYQNSIYFQLQGAMPLWPGALPLDPAGGSAPPTATIQEKSLPLIMFGRLLQPEATFCLRMHNKRLATAGELTGYSAPTDTLAGFKRSLRGRKRRAGKGQERRGWITHCHQFLDPPLLTHDRAYNYILAAVLLSEGLEVKLKPRLIVWRYRLQWFVPPLHSPTVQGSMNPTGCKVEGVVEATATACLHFFLNSLTKINEFTEAYWLSQTWLKQDIGGKPVSNASARTYRRTGDSKAIGLCLQPHL